MPKNLYAIVDIETTGMQVLEDRITEIAVYIHNGEEVIDSFSTLINPEKYIPDYISKLTGISNDMVAGAPRFFEIAKRLVEITEGKVFVAHNAHFDYTFVKNEFKSLGFNFQRKTLCTVRLSRKIFPNLASYSLGKLCQSLHIPHQNQHRAAGDAQATVQLFEKLLNQDAQKVNQVVIDNEVKAKTLPPKISQELFEALPEEAGVYYFYNQQGDIIYIGKSKNIKNRIASHFGVNLKSRKSIEFKNQVADISYEITGSELIALLLESDEIKKHVPIFNRAQRKSRFHYGIFHYQDQKGYWQFYVDKVIKQPYPALALTESAESGRRMLYSKIQQYGLCMKLCNLYKTKGACFDYQIKKCQGACIGEESTEEYNARAQAAIDSFHEYARQTFIIYSRGRERGEKTIVCVENGRYLGFGYIDEYAQIRSFEDAKTYIKHYVDNRDIQKIIGQWIRKHPHNVWVAKN
jgi:DNA polymerase III subunit epsilon